MGAANNISSRKQSPIKQLKIIGFIDPSAFIIEKKIAIYFIIAMGIILFSIFLLYKAKTPSQFNKINTAYKILLMLAIFSIVLY